MIRRPFIKNKKDSLIRVLGKNGVYLALLLLEKGYEVYGTSRFHEVSSFGNLLHLGIRDRVKTMWEELFCLMKRPENYYMQIFFASLQVGTG